MSDEFNPYREWLGLEGDAGAPDYYRLLGLPPLESDLERITAAADRAMARVRSFRPGRQVAKWARLLDEIAAAKQCLSDETQRRQYDGQLLARLSRAHAETEFDANRFPPGYGATGQRKKSAESLASGPTTKPSTECELPEPVWEPAAKSEPQAERSGASGQSAPPNALAALPDFTEMVDCAPVDLIAAAIQAPPDSEPHSAPAEIDNPGLLSTPRTEASPALSASRRDPYREHRSMMPLFVGVGFGFALVVLAAAMAYVRGRASSTPAAPARNPLSTLPASHEPVLDNADAWLPRKPVSGEATEPQRTSSQSSSKSAANPMNAEVGTSEPPAPPKPAQSQDGFSEPLATGAEAVSPKPAANPRRQGGEPTRLVAALRAARQALANRDFQRAESELRDAESVASDDDSRERLGQMETLVACARDFSEAVERAATTMPAATELKVGADTIASVVETSRQRIVVRMNGVNRRYSHHEMPIGLEAALGDAAIGLESSACQVRKAAYVLTSPKASLPDRQKALGWLRDCTSTNPDATAILQAIQAFP